jgi:hypothetical protein
MADDDCSTNTNQSFMSGDSNTTTQIVTLQSDTSNFSAGIKLDENNYSLWHQIIEMKIVGREKHGHLTGDIASLQSQIPHLINGEHQTAKSRVGCLMPCSLIRLKGLFVMTQQSKSGMQSSKPIQMVLMKLRFMTCTEDHS